MKKAASDSPAPKPRKKATSEPVPEMAKKPPAPKSRKVAKKPDDDTNLPPAPKSAPQAQAPSLTVVAARVDIGYGNHLYLRGTGPGLSWETGVPMSNAGSDLWTIDLHDASGPIYCKFLVNDERWSAGPDYIIEPGAQLEVTPLF
jgi:hypothetical protein